MEQSASHAFHTSSHSLSGDDVVAVLPKVVPHSYRMALSSRDSLMIGQAQHYLALCDMGFQAGIRVITKVSRNNAQEWLLRGRWALYSHRDCSGRILCTGIMLFHVVDALSTRLGGGVEATMLMMSFGSRARQELGDWLTHHSQLRAICRWCWIRAMLLPACVQ